MSTRWMILVLSSSLALASEAPADDFLSAAMEHVAAREYWASRSAQGLQAPNRRHGLRTFFEPEGIRVVDRTAPGSPELLSLRLEALGRGDALALVPTAEVHHVQSRVELRRPGLVEWYENRAEGLEQGFTITARPEGEGRLVLALHASGAQVSRRGDALGLRTTTGRRLAYGKLEAFDANGRVLPVELAATAGDRIELRVQDALAAYPLVIDPLLTATDDTQLESDQARASLGFSVASAGDVNGDGYADVIAGAVGYDAGESDEGAAFVFLGGPGGVPDAGALSAQTQLESDQAGAELGSSVAGAGDVNGDGYADVIVGARFYDAPEPAEGAAFVFLGGPGGIADGDPSTAHAQLESDQVTAWFGSGVASAGDVNGDGYADVIVAADRYDAGETDEGAAFVFLGSPTGISDGNPSTAHARIESDQAFAGLGRGVASAGDVNGDGYADVIVGAVNYDAGENDEGAAFVFLGSATGIANGSPASAHARLEGNQEDAILGTSVASAGDVNGDGYADVIVGAAFYDRGQNSEGGAFVFLGSASGIADGSPASAHALLESDQVGAQLGWSVDTAGDVNADGYADVIVGAPSYDGAFPGGGAAFVFLGSASGIADGNPALAFASLEGDQFNAYLGTRVAPAGDVNGDGFADVIVGAYGYDAGEVDEGAAFIFHGGSEGLLDAGASDADTRLESNQDDAGLGVSVASAGDVNGDGYDDVIVGAQGYDAGEADEGAAFVFLGTASGIADAIPTTAHAQLESDQVGGGLGNEVASAGDVNGDGYDDVIVGTDGYDNPETNEGVAFVFHGSASGISDGDPTTAVAVLEFDQANAAVGNGTSVAGAGDVNGDGYADVIIGAAFADVTAGNDGGAALLFYGSSTGIDTSSSDLMEGLDTADRLGRSVSSAGDVNGDGFADVIVGASLADGAAGIIVGAAYVVLGSATGLIGLDATLEGIDPGSSFGNSVASAGDVNGDGYSDVIVGAPFHDEGLGNEGAAFVFLGSATGVDDATAAMADATLDPDQLDSQFGSSVASAGDVNADGYADVIVGSPLFDNGETDEGVAFVFLGSAAGIPNGGPATAATWLEGDQAGADLGRSVASAGDVDGDGVADVIVGASGYDASQTDEGAAFVFHGGDGTGRPVLPRQLDTSSGNTIPAWGTAATNGFDVSLRATHPAGRGLAKLEVEWCPPGAPFGDASCGSQVSPGWTDVTATPGGVTLDETITGLSADTLYRWRARVLHAPFTADAPGVTPPPNPPHGPWRRPAAQAREADVRALPEPGALASLLAGGLLVAALRRRRAEKALRVCP